MTNPLSSAAFFGTFALSAAIGACSVSPDLERTAFGADAGASSAGAAAFGGDAGTGGKLSAACGSGTSEADCPTAAGSSTLGDGGAAAGSGGSAALGGSTALGGSAGGGAGGTSGSHAGLERGLVVYYDFDETAGATAHDHSGLAHDGNVRGGAAWTADGRVGGALRLSGGSWMTVKPEEAQYVELPTGILGGLDQTTVAAWIRWEGGGDWQRLFDFGSDSNHGLFWTPQVYGDMLAVLKPSTANAKDLYLSVKKLTPPPGAWIHVALSWSSSTLAMYLNAQLVATTPQDSAPAPGGGPAALILTLNNFIGRSQSAMDDYFGGTVDEFRVYDRELTPLEIAALRDFRP